MKTNYVLTLTDGSAWRLNNSPFSNGSELWEQIKLHGGVATSPTQYIPAQAIIRITKVDWE